MRTSAEEKEGTTRSFYERKVADYMTTEVLSLSPDATLREAGSLFAHHDFNLMPVLEEGSLIGVFSKFDFMRAFAFTNEHPLPDYLSLMKTPVRMLMRDELLTVTPDMPLTRVLQKMVDTKTRSFPVVSEGRLVGVISREDIMRALADSTAATTEFFCREVQSRLSV